MAGFEFGEELVVLKKLDVGSTRYKPGDDFEYEELDLDFVEKLLGQRILIRKALVSQRLMGQLKSSKVAKIIKNVKGVRMAISWPSDEDLPEGVLDYRFSKNDAPQADLKEEIEKQEPPAQKKVKVPRRRAKTTLKKDFE
jgi:hypothetical protein